VQGPQLLPHQHQARQQDAVRDDLRWRWSISRLTGPRRSRCRLLGHWI
jgi:hypothetical protein